MFDLDNWQEIWATITMNKGRSILTGFGVFWGIFMLIILMGIGNGFRDGMYNNVKGFASNSVFFQSGRTSEAYKGYRKGRWWSMNSRDLTLIRQNAKTVDEIAPVLWGSYSDNNTVNGLKAGSYSSRGVYPSQFRIEQTGLSHGRFINDLDIEANRKVCLIGKQIYETLFDIGEDPIGQSIRHNGIYFRVVGVVFSQSNISIGGRVDETVFIPFSTMQHTFMRGDYFWFMALTTKKGVRAEELQEEVTTILKASHDISPTDEKAVWSMNLEREFQRFQGMITGVEVLIWFVGLGALLSGVFGISNIMLVTVRERMREIGIRRAIGATPFNIMSQILLESVVLTAIAGLLGFLFGVGIIVAIESVMTANGPVQGMMQAPSISFNMGLISMGILILSGLLAGILPTLRALQIKAIDAIRDE